jgi:hypothetical protein
MLVTVGIVVMSLRDLIASNIMTQHKKCGKKHDYGKPIDERVFKHFGWCWKAVCPALTRSYTVLQPLATP